MVGLVASLMAVSGLTASGGGAVAVAGPTPGGVTSGAEVQYVGFVPFEQSTSTGATIRGKYMYTTSWKNISTYDISNPESPQLLDQLPVGFMFENEDVAVSPNQTFLLFSESLPNDVLHVYDVEDKSNIQEIAAVEGAGDHTTSCILHCDYTYGSDGSITDLRDPANPKVVALDTDENNWHAKIGLQGGAHDVTEVKDGFILVSPIDGPPLYVDVSDPANPKVVARGNDNLPRGERGYLWHSGEWPRAGQDRWLLMQGEDNFNPECQEKIGPFATYDTRGWQTSKTFKLTDTYKVTNGVVADGDPPANALGCSAHWFEEHQSFNNGGLVVIAFYEHGTRFLNVDKETGKITRKAFFLPYGGSTSATYWVNDEIVYAVDYTRGIDILRYKELPGPRVRLSVNDRTATRGETIKFRSSLRRCKGHGGTDINLMRKLEKEDKFVQVATKKLEPACSAVTFKQMVGFRGKATYKAVWPKQDDDHRQGTSRPLTITGR